MDYEIGAETQEPILTDEAFTRLKQDIYSDKRTEWEIKRTKIAMWTGLVGAMTGLFAVILSIVNKLS